MVRWSFKRHLFVPWCDLDIFVFIAAYLKVNSEDEYAIVSEFGILEPVDLRTTHPWFGVFSALVRYIEVVSLKS